MFFIFNNKSIFFILLFSALVPAFSDQIWLHDGSVIRAHVTDITENEVILQLQAGERKIPRESVNRILLGENLSDDDIRIESDKIKKQEAVDACFAEVFRLREEIALLKRNQPSNAPCQAQESSEIAAAVKWRFSLGASLYKTGGRAVEELGNRENSNYNAFFYMLSPVQERRLGGLYQWQEGKPPSISAMSYTINAEYILSRLLLGASLEQMNWQLNNRYSSYYDPSSPAMVGFSTTTFLSLQTSTFPLALFDAQAVGRSTVYFPAMYIASASIGWEYTKEKYSLYARFSAGIGKSHGIINVFQDASWVTANAAFNAGARRFGLDLGYRYHFNSRYYFLAEFKIARISMRHNMPGIYAIYMPVLIPALERGTIMNQRGFQLGAGFSI